MYAVHQDARLLATDLVAPEYVRGDRRIPALSVSSSLAEDGTAHVSLCNLYADEEIAIEARVEGLKPTQVSGRVLTGAAVNAHNTFDAPDAVRPVALKDVTLTGDGFRVTLPARSVVVVTLR